MGKFTVQFIDPLRNAMLAPIVLGAIVTTVPQRAIPRIKDDVCTSITFEGSRFFTCRVHTQTHEVSLALTGGNGKPLRNFAALQSFRGADSSPPLLAMNAGMYDEKGYPIGLYVESGKRRHPLNRRNAAGNFYMKPNGVFARWHDGRLSVESSEQFAKHRATPLFATQSGPMLVVSGKIHPKLAADGDSRFIRNGVGVVNAQTAWIVISQDRVSFGRFARLFRDRLGCTDALFLDGIVSSAWHPATGRMDGRWALGPMFVVTKRGQ